MRRNDGARLALKGRAGLLHALRAARAESESLEAMVSQIELGEANATLDSLIKVAIAMKVDFAGLFENDGETSPRGSRRRSPQR